MAPRGRKSTWIMPHLSQKTLAITLPADAIARNFFGGGESTCFHCFDACFDSIVKWLCSLFPQKDSSLMQFHDRLCVDYPGSGVPLTKCSQEWLLWAGNHNGQGHHWWTYSHLWNVYTIQMSYWGWVSHHRTVPEVFCRYLWVLCLCSRETSSPHTVPCMH